jgi:hypothetical protein
MDLSQLKWLKNVRPDQGWAYSKLDEMPIPEARIFRLHWRSKDDKANAQQPLKGDLIALVQSARVTHIVELLDNVVYENAEEDWGIYRVAQAVWMPNKVSDWLTLPHQNEIFGVEHLPQNGLVYKIPTEKILQSQHWKDLEGLQGFQEHLNKILTQVT